MHTYFLFNTQFPSILRIYQRRLRIRLVTLNQFNTWFWKLMCCEVSTTWLGSRTSKWGSLRLLSDLVMHKQLANVTFAPPCSINPNDNTSSRVFFVFCRFAFTFFSFYSLLFSRATAAKMGFPCEKDVRNIASKWFRASQGEARSFSLKLNQLFNTRNFDMASFLWTK